MIKTGEGSAIDSTCASSGIVCSLAAFAPCLFISMIHPTLVQLMMLAAAASQDSRLILGRSTLTQRPSLATIDNG